jgi:hypothetical protein
MTGTCLLTASSQGRMGEPLALRGWQGRCGMGLAMGWRLIGPSPFDITEAHSLETGPRPMCVLRNALQLRGDPVEAAVEQMNPAGRAQFRACFERFDAADWDQQLEHDVEAGYLDWLVEEALGDLKAGRCRELGNIRPVHASGVDATRRPRRCRSTPIGPMSCSKRNRVTLPCISSESDAFGR